MYERRLEIYFLFSARLPLLGGLSLNKSIINTSLDEPANLIAGISVVPITLLVVGDVTSSPSACLSLIHSLIARFSYMKPSSAATGSKNNSRVMVQTRLSSHTAEVVLRPSPREDAEEEDTSDEELTLFPIISWDADVDLFTCPA
eukprot:CAMPEP_0178515692 /NCGR_PEP_ID=MMETSP0696-20121128/24694_1 /TAXON_ID=265572 /ORGANISM="Extubocellulus spinifer, Strain CCMP396" /LENGTH=144 /DNA_ID=CAMNT_0020145875 /DNA_START=153 /DNA_END=588 /DNA_ORIENTATION=+